MLNSLSKEGEEVLRKNMPALNCYGVAHVLNECIGAVRRKLARNTLPRIIAALSFFLGRLAQNVIL